MFFSLCRGIWGLCVDAERMVRKKPRGPCACAMLVCKTSIATSNLFIGLSVRQWLSRRTSWHRLVRWARGKGKSASCYYVSMLAWVCYIIISTVWGSTYLAIFLGLESLSAFAVVAVRFSLAFPLAFILGRIRREAWPSRAEILPIMTTGAILLGGSNILVTWSENHVPTGIAAVLTAFVPIWLAILSIRRERLGPLGWLGLALGVVGVGVLVWPSEELRIHVGGTIALLLAAFLWAFGTLYGKEHIKTGGLFTNVAIQMSVGAAIAWTGALVTGSITIAPLSLEVVSAELYLAVFGSVIAFSAYVYLAQVWPPARVGTYAYLNPLVAVLLGTMLLNEPLGWRGMVGLVIVLIAVALVQLKNHALKKKERQA